MADVSTLIDGRSVLMKRLILLPLLLWLAACQQSPTDTNPADDTMALGVVLTVTEPCTNGDCPLPDDPGCTNGDCPPPDDPGCTNGDCPPPDDPGCTNGDCPPDPPGCSNGDCPPGTVLIDIKPGSYPNCFNNDGHGVIPVAILSSATFDATQIDASTVTLEGLSIGARGRANKLMAHLEDVNGDGLIDLVVQIEDVDGAFTSGNGTATLTGYLFDGSSFQGTDEICVVPNN
jgi:hypothetical protein